MSDDPHLHKSDNAWSQGSYSEIALFLLPASAHLVRLCNVSSNDHVLDVACGTGNTAITAKRQGDAAAKVTGVDSTPEMLAQAKAETSLAEVDDIEWKEGNVDDPLFEDNSFDVVLSIFGHMFAPHPEVVIREMLRVTKSGGRIAFATWPHELANGNMFDVMAKHIMTPSTPNNNQMTSPPPLSPMQWVDLGVVKKCLGNNVNNIHFKRRVVTCLVWCVK